MYKLFFIGLLAFINIENSFQQLGVAIEMFPLIRARLGLAFDVAIYKYKGCKNITDPDRELEIITSLVTKTNGTDHSITEQFLKSQMEANKIVQYGAILGREKSFITRPIVPLEKIRSQLNEIDNKMITILQESVVTIKNNFKNNKDSCLTEVFKAAETYYPSNDSYNQVATIKACSVFIELCISTPICVVDEHLNK